MIPPKKQSGLIKDNLHLLEIPKDKKTSFKKRTRTPKKNGKADDDVDFSDLGKKIESNIDGIEVSFKKSMEVLEEDIHKAINSSKLKFQEHDVKNDLINLAALLETRIHKTLSLITNRERLQKEDRAHVETIKKLTSHLTKALSFDFYKSVIDRLGMAEYAEEVDPFGMDRRFIEKIKPAFDFLYYRFWRVQTTGIENIPNEGRALIVANHSGTMPYDGAMIKTAILNEHPGRKDARFLVENFVYHMPFLGNLMYRIGGVRACPENAEMLLDSGHLVVVFPEGVKGIGKYFSDRYKLQRFGRGGFVRLCMKTKSPLIPVGVVGAEEIHPILFKSNIIAKTIGVPYIPITPTFPLLGLLGCVPFPTKWYIHFGKPLDFNLYTRKDWDDDLLIHQISENVRGNIQEIIFDLLRKRRSIWY